MRINNIFGFQQNQMLTKIGKRGKIPFFGYR